MESWHNFLAYHFNGVSAVDLDTSNYTIDSSGDLWIYKISDNTYIKTDIIYMYKKYDIQVLQNEGNLYEFRVYKINEQQRTNLAIIYIEYRINTDELLKRVRNKTGFKCRPLLKNYLHQHFNQQYVTNVIPYKKLIKKLMKPVEYEILEKKPYPNLMNFQNHNVQWMISLEKELSKMDLEYTSHEYLEILSKDGKEMVYYDPKTELFNNKLIENKTFRFYGGALIDEMGCGKTACAVTLCIAKTPKPIDLETYRKEKRLPMSGNRIKSRASLIMVPNHISRQWAGEIEKFNFKKNFKPVIICISDVRDYRKYTYADLINADFVITTYQYLFNQSMNDQLNNMFNYVYGSESNRYSRNKSQLEYEKAARIFIEETCGDFNLLDKSYANLLHFRWNRIILDECQEWMAGRNYHARWYLSQFFDSKFRWCLSGTPFENIDNLQNIIGFLTKNYKESRLLFKNKQAIYHLLSKNVFRRNTISSTIAETPLKNIKIIEKTIWVKFTKQERLIYQSKITGRARETFLRQFCCSPFTPTELDKCKSFDDIIKEMRKNIEQPLIKNKNDLTFYKNHFNQKEMELQNAINLGFSDNIISDLQKEYKTLEKKKNERQDIVDTLESSLKYYDNLNAIMHGDDGIECPICYGIIGEDSENIEESMSMTKCGHIFCTECINETLNSGNNRLCPTCRKSLARDDVYVVSQTATQEIEEDNSEYAQLYRKVGSKIARLILYIRETLKDPENYIILFAEWEHIMNRIGQLLETYGIKTAVCKGNKASREAAIRRFNHTKDHRLIMLSSSYASHGTNLTKANKIVIVNPVGGTKEHREDIEAQAIARSFRLGQTRNLEVVRFVIKDSIEEKMYNETFNTEDTDNIIVVE